MSIYDKSSLVLIPSGTKTGKVFSQKPVSGDGDFTFTRASAATRVNASGNIEKETSNLLLQSNQFDTTWSNNGTTETSGQSGYDGSSDAWLLEKSIAGGSIRQSIVFNGVGTYSVYAKAGTLNYILLYINYGSGTDTQAYFDLSNGSVGTTIAEIDANIESVGNGWYRCSVSFSTPSATATTLFFPAQGDGDTSGTSGNIYIQDAQLEQGLVARDYIETTTTAIYGGITDNVPRLDYTDSSCPALLLEPLRTNLIAYSEYFNGADWINVGVTATENAVISPEGVQNATQLNFTGTSYKRFEQNTSNAATACTTSIFMKYINHDIVMARMDSTSGASYAWFNIQTGEVLKVDGANGSVPDPIASVDDYGDGWYRLNTTQNSMASNQEIFWYFVPDINTSTGGWTGSGSAYAYGAQFEEGSYATSYIPTYGSSVTRNAENTKATNVSDLIGQSEGTLYVETKGQTKDSSLLLRVAQSGGVYGDSIYIDIAVGGSLRAVIFNNYVSQMLSTTSVTDGQSIKAALAYSNNDCVFYLNGTQIASDISVSLPTSLADILLGSYYPANSAQQYKGTNQALVFKTRLSNEELADLTTI